MTSKKKPSKKFTDHQKNKELKKKFKSATEIDYISFSFKFLTNNEEAFNYEQCSSQYFVKLLDRLKNASSMTTSDFFSKPNRTLRNHKLNEDKIEIIRKYVREDLFDCELCYQFCISVNEHGRVHGFFIGSVFHVVFLDKEHLMYPKKK